MHSLINCVASLIMLGWQEDSHLTSRENEKHFVSSETFLSEVFILYLH